jgi:transposase
MVERTVSPEFRMSDEFFARIEPLLPKFRKSKKGGRPRLGWRQVIDGIFYVLRTGCQWKAMPPEFGSGSGVHNYFQLLVRRRIFTKLWKAALEEYDDLQGIDWKWQAMDGAMSKAPLGGEKNREKPHRSRQARHQAFAVDRRGWRALVGRRQRRQHT